MFAKYIFSHFKSPSEADVTVTDVFRKLKQNVNQTTKTVI